MREASSAENSTSGASVRASRTPATAWRSASSALIFSLYLRWIADVARKVWITGPRRASQRLAGGLDVGRLGARQCRDLDAADLLGDGTAPPRPRAGEAIGKPRLDHVDAEPLELPRQAQLLGGVHAAARRLLAVAERGVEDRDRAAFIGPAPTALAASRGLAVFTSPSGVTVTGSRNGIMPRSCAPTFSMLVVALRARARALNQGRPASFSSIHSRA